MKNNINKKIGATLLTAAVMTGTFVIPVAKATDAEIKAKPSVSYQAHVENIGWQDAINSGIAGTTGQCLRMEAIRMKLENCENASLSFDVHIQDIGWKYNLTEEDIIGTTGKCLKMEAINIKSKGLAEKGYKIQYRVHGENYGWTNWVEEGTVAGTTGEFLRLEAIEVRVVTDSTAVEPAKEKAVIELTNYVENSALKNIVPGSDMQYAAATAINEKIAAGYSAIWNAKSVEEVTTAVETSKANILTATKEYVEHLLNTIYNGGEGYVVNGVTYYLTATDYDKSLEVIKNATTEAEAINEFATVVEKELNKDEYNLAMAKIDAIAQLNAYVNKEDYTINAEALETAIENGENAIKECTEIKEIAKAISDAKAVIDTIESDAIVLADLIEAQENATTELTNYVENSKLKNIIPGSDMQYASVPDITGALAEGYASISKTTEVDAVEETLKTIKENVLNKTKEYVQFLLDTVYKNGEETGKYLSYIKYESYSKEIEESTTIDNVIETYEYVINVELMDLAQLKTYFEEKLNTCVEKNDYSVENAEKVTQAINDGKTAINEATTQNEIDKAYNAAIEVIGEIASNTDINNAKTEFKNYFNSALSKTVTTIDGEVKELKKVTEINQVIKDGNVAIEECTTKTEISDKLTEVENEILETTRTYIKGLLEEAKKAGFTSDGKYLKESDYREALNNIVSSEASLETIVTSYNKAIATCQIENEDVEENEDLVK